MQGKAQHERPMERSSLSCVRPQFGMYDDIAEETGYADRTLRLVKETAEKIESGRRLPELSFSHHVEVASLPPSGSIRSTRTEQPLKEAPRYQKRTSGRCPSQRRRATCYSGSLKLTSNKGF